MDARKVKANVDKEGIDRKRGRRCWTQALTVRKRDDV